MKRKEFITLLGVGTGSIVVASCLGGCSKGGDRSPVPKPNPGTLLLTINGITNNTDIVNQGWTIKNGIIVAKNGAGYIAVSSLCTHQQQPLVYQSNNAVFYCGTHGSTFNTDGSVKVGPAQTALQKYTPQYDAVNDVLKVYA